MAPQARVDATHEHRLTFTEALDRIQATKIELLEADLRKLRYAGGRSFSIDGRLFEFSSDAWATVCRYVAVPPDLLPQLGRNLGSIVLKALHGAGRKAEGAPDQLRLVRNGQGSIVAVGPRKLAVLCNEQVVPAIEEAWPPHIPSETLSVAKLRLADTEFELICHTDCLTVEPRPGDVLHGGIRIRHSQAGASPTVVMSYIHRLVCSNGTMQRVCLQGKPSRTKRSKAGSSPKRILEAIKTQISQAWAQLDERLRGVKELLNHPMPVDQLPEGLRRRWSVNRTVAAEIAQALQADELGHTGTEYDLVNAISRVATHSARLAPRYAAHLSLAAGMFAQRHIHQCPTCGSWLVGSADSLSASVQR